MSRVARSAVANILDLVLAQLVLRYSVGVQDLLRGERKVLLREVVVR